MKRFILAALLALGGCSAQEADIMPGGSKETLYDRLVGIREVQNSAGQIIRSTDGKGIFRLTPGTGIELAFNPTKESYEITQGVGSVLSVPTTRTITVGPGLTIDGGGSADLSANRSIAFPGPVSASQHGVQTNGTLHSLAADAVPSPTNGFMSGSDAGWIYGMRRFEGEDGGPFGAPHVKTVAGLLVVDVGGSGAVNLTIDMTQAAPNNPKDGMLISVCVLTINPGDMLNISANDGWSIAWAFPTVTLANSFASVTLRADLATKFLYIVGSFAFP